MLETRTHPDSKQLLDQVKALRAGVRKPEQPLSAQSPLSSSSASTPLTSPFFPYELVSREAEEGVAALGDQQRILYCNERLVAILQIAYSHLLDRTFVELVVPQHQARVRDFLAPDQAVDRINVSLVTGDRRHLPVQLVKHRPGTAGSPISLSVSITELKKTAQRARPMQPLFELFHLAPAAMFLSRLEDSRLIEVNDRFLQLTGYRRAQVIGKSALALGLWPSAASRALAVECLQRGGTVHHFVGKVRCQRGNARHVLFSAGLLARGGEQFLLGMLEDVTEHKHEQDFTIFQSQLLANVQDAVIATDLKETITYWNRAAEQIYGWKLDQAIGRNLHQVMRSNTSRQKRAETLKLVKEAGRLFTPDAVHHRRDGSLMHVEATLVAIHGEDGEVRGFAGSYRDVTERRRADEALRKSEEKFAKMFQASTTAMALTTREGVELDVNESLLKLLGYRREDLVGRNVLDLDFWPDLVVAARIGVMIAKGQPVRNIEVQWRTHAGETKDVLLSVEPLEVNGRTCLLGMATDITDRKRAEQQIRTLNAMLEQRVAERTTELARANQALTKEIAERKQDKNKIEALNRHLEQRATELEAANQELEAFSYSVSHDLRTPLASVDGFSAILQENYGHQLVPEAARYLDLIRSNTKQMNELIVSLLRLSRLNRQPIKKQSVKMTALVKEALESLQKEGGEGVPIHIGRLADAVADPVLLRQVWVNLLANAIKFSRKSENPRVEVGCGPCDGENRVYFVRDNGVGFDMEHAERLFGIFQRLHGEEEYEGTGIGLAIVQRIIRRHGGRVWAEGHVGQGATFYFTLN